jgi:hypothetical protein
MLMQRPDTGHRRREGELTGRMLLDLEIKSVNT